MQTRLILINHTVFRASHFMIVLGIFILNMSVCARPANVPLSAEIRSGGGYSETINSNGIQRYRSWDANGDKNKEITTIGNYIQINEYQDDKIHLKYQQTPYDPQNKDYGFVEFGKKTVFRNDGSVEMMVCMTPQNEDLNVPKECKKKVLFNSGQSKVISISEVCLFGCGEFQPEISNGEYRVIVNSIRVRKAPNKDGEILMSIPKEHNVFVLEDTRKIEKIEDEIAPWVKVRTESGAIGYIFGGFIRKKNEFYFNIVQIQYSPYTIL
jgi:hypothetical protein